MEVGGGWDFDPPTASPLTCQKSQNWLGLRHFQWKINGVGLLHVTSNETNFIR